MTKQEFKSLKIGDRCYLKNCDGKYTNTEILDIDRLFGKVSVLLRSKPISYKKIPLKLKNNQEEWGFVGICKTYKI